MGEAIGFIGLGRMGLPLAHRLLEAGHSLRVWNRTARKADFLVELGAEDVTHPRDVVDPGGIVFTMVTDDHALTEVVTGPNGFAERLGPRGVHVSMSTVSPATARHLAELRCRQQSEYVAAPVFGRPDAVAMGKLWMCLSGSRGAKDRVGVLIRQLGQGMFDFGDDPGAAHVVKLAGNFVLAAAIESLAEAVIFAGRNGIGRQQLADLLGQTLFACPAYQIYGKAIAEERYTPAGFTTH